MKQIKIKAGEFKAKCLKLMDHVHKYHDEITITKHDKPIAKLVPIENEVRKHLFGALKGTLRIDGDIVSPTGVEWDAEK